MVPLGIKYLRCQHVIFSNKHATLIIEHANSTNKHETFENIKLVAYLLVEFAYLMIKVACLLLKVACLTPWVFDTQGYYSITHVISIDVDKSKIVYLTSEEDFVELMIDDDDDNEVLFSDINSDKF